MRNEFVKELSLLAQEDPRVFAVLADNGLQVFDDYQGKFANQFLNLGIAEANLVGVSAGMASCGFIPFAYTILPFLTMRAYEFIRDDVCYQNQNVKLAAIGAGFTYSTLGPTHHGTEDIGLVRALPNLTIFSPADPMETRKVTRAAYEIDGPVYLRIGKGKDPVVYEADYDFVVGKGVVLSEGSHLTIVSTGSMVSECKHAVALLASEGISAQLVNFHTLKPFDADLLVKCAKKTGVILVAEDHATQGGLGGLVAETLMHHRAGNVAFHNIGLRDKFAEGYGSVMEMRKLNGLDALSVAMAAKNLLRSAK